MIKGCARGVVLLKLLLHRPVETAGEMLFLLECFFVSSIT